MKFDCELAVFDVAEPHKGAEMDGSSCFHGLRGEIVVLPYGVE